MTEGFPWVCVCVCVCVGQEKLAASFAAALVPHRFDPMFNLISTVLFSSTAIRYEDDEYDEDEDQVDFMSRYHYEQFGVGYVGEQRKESLSPLYFDDDGLAAAAPASKSKANSTPIVQSGNYKYVNSTRDLTLPLQNHRNAPPMYESPDDEEISVRKYLGVSVGLVSLITENLLSHPFVVLRRQCQVHHSSSRKHLVPFTLLPVIIHLHQRQGITTLWKGLGSCLLVRGMSLAVDDLISKVTPWPK